MVYPLCVPQVIYIDFCAFGTITNKFKSNHLSEFSAHLLDCIFLGYLNLRTSFT